MVEKSIAFRSDGAMFTPSRISKFASGTADECLDQCRGPAATGVTQMTLTFQGDEPEAAMARFGNVARGA